MSNTNQANYSVKDPDGNVSKILISYHWSWVGLQMQIMLLVGSLGCRYVLQLFKTKK
jgi:hypothetical protein